MYLCNKERYGYLNVPAKPHHTLEDDRLNFVHVLLESMSKNTVSFDYLHLRENENKVIQGQKKIRMFLVSSNLCFLLVKQSMDLQWAPHATSICSRNRETSWALMRWETSLFIWKGFNELSFILYLLWFLTGTNQCLMFSLSVSCLSWRVFLITQQIKQ